MNSKLGSQSQRADVLGARSPSGRTDRVLQRDEMTSDNRKHESTRQSQAAFTTTVLLAIAMCITVRSLSIPSAQVKADRPIAVYTDPVSRQVGKVLLVHSYHSGYPWVDVITRGVQMALDGQHIEVKTFYMDTKRRTDLAWKEQAGAEAKEIVAQWQPDVVIAADDNAQQYFAKDYVETDGPSVVFCGVNAKLSVYGYPARNVTGILERPHFAESLGMLSRLLPQARHIAIVTDDSPTSTGAIDYMIAPAPWRIVSCEQPRTLEQWRAAIGSAQNRADAIAVYMYHTLKDGDGQTSVEPSQVMSWTVKNSRIPIVGFSIFAVDDGVLCGYLESGVEHGFKAGQMAREILDGTAPGEIPIVTALEGHAMINLATARDLDIEVPSRVLIETAIVVEE